MQYRLVPVVVALISFNGQYRVSLLMFAVSFNDMLVDVYDCFHGYPLGGLYGVVTAQEVCDFVWSHRTDKLCRYITAVEGN